VAELKHKINLKAMQFISAQMFLNGTKPAIFYTRCYMLFFFRKFIINMYIVKLSAKDGNEDYQFVNVEVSCNNQEIAVNKAVDYYYTEYWTNTEWRKEEF
jgi:hypothetical protein